MDDSQDVPSPAPPASSVADDRAALLPIARASYHDLPTEVCKALVELAHEQSEQMDEIGVLGGTTIAALSLVNKRLRELALPYLITVGTESSRLRFLPPRIELSPWSSDFAFLSHRRLPARSFEA